MIVVHIVFIDDPWYPSIEGPFSSETAAKEWIEEDYITEYGGELSDLSWVKNVCYILDGVGEGGYEIVTLSDKFVK